MPAVSGLYTLCLGYQCVIPRLFAIKGWTQVYDSSLYPGYGEAGGKVYSSNGQLIIENYGTLEKKYGVVGFGVIKEQGKFYTSTVKVKCDYLSTGTLTLEVFDANRNRIEAQSAASSPIADWQLLQVQIPQDITGNQNIFLHVDSPGRCYFKEPQLSEGLSALEFRDTTDMVREECCPENYCWTGSGCIENQANEPWEIPLVNLIDQSYGYRCIDGNWELSQKKTTWDGASLGYCPSNSDCLVNPARRYDFYKSLTDYTGSVTSYYSEDITLNSPSIQCINNREFLADHYCDSGLWSTRTRQLALQLANLANAQDAIGKDYTLYCEGYKKILANYTEPVISSYTIENFTIGKGYRPSRLQPIRQSCFYDEATRNYVDYLMPCANNFCILKYDHDNDPTTSEKVVLGASLNRHITEEVQNQPTPFIATLKDKNGNRITNDFPGICDDVVNRLNQEPCLSDVSQCDQYYDCGDNSDIDNYLWYNPVKGIFIYSRSEGGVSFTEYSLGDFISSPYQAVIGFIINLWRPTFREGWQPSEYTFIEKTKDFNKIYLSRYDNTRTIKGIKEKVKDDTEKEYFSFEFKEFSPETDVSKAVEQLKNNTYERTGRKLDIDVKSSCGRHYIITQEPNAIDYFVDLGAKLRIQPQTTAPETCTTCQEWINNLGAVAYNPSRELCLGESLSYGDGSCCLGEVEISNCKDIGGVLCAGACSSGFVSRAQVAVVLSSALALDTSNVPACGSETFTDVPCDYWAYRQIEAVKNAGIVIGFDDGTYKPEQLITRAQAADFLVRAFNFDMTAPACGSETFTDIPCDYWAYRQIEAIAREGITVGTAAGAEGRTYGPEINLNRAQLAIYIARAAELCNQDSGQDCNSMYTCDTRPTSPFTDIDCRYWAYPWIIASYEANIIRGYADETFGPGDLRSAETAVNPNIICCMGTCTPNSCSSLGNAVVCTANDICEGTEITAQEGGCCIGSCRDTIPPAAPTSLTATTSTPPGSYVDLSWNAPADADLDYYNIYRSQFADVFNDQNLIAATTEFFYRDTNVINGVEYYYQVRAVDSSSNIGPFSNTQSCIAGNTCLELRQLNLIFYTKSPWEGFSTDEEIGSTISSLDLGLARNEYESAALMIKNPTPSAMNVEIQISDLKSGNNIIPASQITIRETAWIELAPFSGFSRGFYIDPLKPISTIKLNPGETHQLWLTVQTKKDLADDYTGTLTFKFGNFRKTIVLNVKVWDFILPEKVPINVFTWSDFLNAGATSPSDTYYQRVNSLGLENAYLDNFIEHGSNTLSAFPPWPKCDANGNIDQQEPLRAVTLIEHDMEVSTLKRGGMLHFFLGFEFENARNFYLGNDSLFYEGNKEAWKKCLQSWIQEWVFHMRNVHGITYDDFMIQIVDEPPSVKDGQTGDPRIQIFLDTAAEIKAADPSVKLMENPFYVSPTYYTSLSDLNRMKPYIDLWIPELATFQQQDYYNFFKAEQTAGKEVWTYEPCCVGGNYLSRLPSSSYYWYRLKPWIAWVYGLDGVTFWTATWWQKDPWNDFDTLPIVEYGVVYSGKEVNYAGAVDSRRWEAWREGLEDYKYLWLLNEKIKQTDDPQAKQILADALHRVVNGNVGNMQNPKKEDFLALEEWRTKIAEQIIRLS